MNGGMMFQCAGPSRIGDPVGLFSGKGEDGASASASRNNRKRYMKPVTMFFMEIGSLLFGIYLTRYETPSWHIHIKPQTLSAPYSPSGHVLMK
jgi:hypothetical protein